ncbi:hypothetical protein VOLCADRAFT_88718 [Volvox carteri f. nagariensis]|uniref:Uncharacterized protein n=1 Tax=Volvox carteri f. nagariensis TaxID=3068 RepID=D8TPS1_VOLCA|nr:uncharacterized protein VOLCADRAFT_88718 [Volvox carteri f. nagariensis]EFJ50282.1 hypothetical protein VOLCADRAFT_88718 [Volvox carteri f. nagariensis]|eukprot:XP_002948407.1 hypothetical protein VOLCADRAFT_88718 [Volvox carteri f. nagariensis]
MWFEEGRQSGVVRCELVSFPPLSLDELDILQRVEDQLLSINEALATDLGQQEQHLPARASKSAKDAHTAKIESIRCKYEAQCSRLLRANPSVTDLKTHDAAWLTIQERKLQLISGVPLQGWHPLPNVGKDDGELPVLDNAGPGGSGGLGQHGRVQGAVEGGAQGACVPAGSDLETIVDNGGYNQLAWTIIGNLERSLGQATTSGLLAADLTAAPGLLGPFGDMLSLAADQEDVLDTVPEWGSIFKAAGGQHLVSNQSAFNSHANHVINHNIAPAQAAAVEFNGTQDPEARVQLAVQVAQHYKTASKAQQTQKQLNDMSQLLPYKEVIRLARDGDPCKTSLVTCLASLSSEQRAYLGVVLTGQPQSASRSGSKWPFAAMLAPGGGPKRAPRTSRAGLTPPQQLEMVSDTVAAEAAAAVVAQASALVAAAMIPEPLPPAPGRPWFGQAGSKLVTEAWLRWGYTFLQGIYDALGTLQYPPPSSVTLPEGALDDLHFWQDVLRPDSSVWDGVKRCVMANLDLAQLDCPAPPWPVPAGGLQEEGSCSVCGRCCGAGDLHCAYPGGWYRCTTCLLAAAGIGSVAQGSVTEELAQLAVVLHGSAVADSSSVTYELGRRCFVRFCVEVAGVPEADALPRQRGSDLNRDLVCLFIAHAVGRYATSTVTGTLSTLADWQRFMGVSPEAYISRDPLVKRTLGQALRRTAAGPESAPSMAKAPLPLGVLRLLVAWDRSNPSEAVGCLLVTNTEEHGPSVQRSLVVSEEGF